MVNESIAVLWVAWSIAFLVLYHKVFTVYYFNLGNGLFKEIIMAGFVGAIMAALTVRLWCIAAIVVVLIGFGIMKKKDSKAPIVIALIAAIAVSVVGIQAGGGGEDAHTKDAGTNGQNNAAVAENQNDAGNVGNVTESSQGSGNEIGDAPVSLEGDTFLEWSDVSGTYQNAEGTEKLTFRPDENIISFCFLDSNSSVFDYNVDWYETEDDGVLILSYSAEDANGGALQIVGYTQDGRIGELDIWDFDEQTMTQGDYRGSYYLCS